MPMPVGFRQPELLTKRMLSRMVVSSFAKDNFPLISAFYLISVLLLADRVTGFENVSAGNLIEDNVRSFVIDTERDTFLMDGKPFRFVSGSVHYFRTPHQYWRDRLRATRAAGLNAVCTYVEWSFHEPEKNQLLWTGDQDLIKFIQIAQEEDLYVILRPGPYICAERDNGGLPYWLFSLYPTIKLRSSDDDYKREVAIWYSRLMPKIKPYLYANGGPIIMVQVENEYGSFDPIDKEYMSWLHMTTEHYVSGAAVLFTTDGNSESSVSRGSTPGVYPTVDFGAGTNVTQAWNVMRKFAPHGPLINSEFYPGWLTHWNESFQRVHTAPIIKTLDDMLKTGASVNFYMFHGGTNFAFTAGANFGSSYTADITSYDYDAPITEAGDITEKYLAIRKKIGEYLPLPDIPIPISRPKAQLRNVMLTPRLCLLNDSGRDFLGKNKKQLYHPISMEAMGQYSGLILYETDLPKNRNVYANLVVPGLRDRAIVYVDSEFLGVISRQTKEFSIEIPLYKGTRLQLLVENQGRINYKLADDIKGIISTVILDDTTLKNWTITSFPLNDVSQINNNLDDVNCRSTYNLYQGPVIYTAENILFNEAEPLDTFLDMRGWGKGFVWINGRNLGRYWSTIGPQKTLYVPGVYLNKPPTPNTLTILEMETTPAQLSVDFLQDPILD